MESNAWITSKCVYIFGTHNNEYYTFNAHVPFLNCVYIFATLCILSKASFLVGFLNSPQD